MKNIVYIQCDSRYNRWLLERLGENSVIEYTIEQTKKLGCEKIIVGIYECCENEQLLEVLTNTKGVDIVVSHEDDVNVRFLECVTKEEADYVIRIGGDQVLIDIEKVYEIVSSMYESDLDWFYDEEVNCVLPDIVSIRCLKRYFKDIITERRYFLGLYKKENIKKYELPYPMLLAYNFRINSEESMRICKNIVVNHLDVYELSKKLLQRLKSNNYLNQTGIWGSWLLSYENQDFFFDENKEINPWWGRTIIDFIKPRLNKSMSVFEWGAGNSTLFWGNNVKSVVTIEYDKNWYKKMEAVIPPNVRLRYVDLFYDGDYCRAILDEEEKYDIILVDGRDRVRCAKNAIARLKGDGVIIWDDTFREYYSSGFDYLSEKGFKRMELKSVVYMTPGYGHTTSIFYRKDNCLGI